MLINKVSIETSTTKKAIIYYIEKGLITPCSLKNGYREFTEKDISKIKEITILRKLGLGIEDITEVLSDTTGGVLQKLSFKKELDIEKDILRQGVMDKLSGGISYKEIIDDIKIIEDRTMVADKILQVFPDRYGRFIWLHFARFLNEPIITYKQRCAYEKIIKVLDDMPKLEFTPEIENYMAHITKNISNNQIVSLVEETKKSMENIDEFLVKNKEQLDKYLIFKKSDEYRNAIAYRFGNMMKDFYNTKGYYEIFIPAMKELSSSYYEYTICIEEANKKLIAQYPDIEKYDL